MEPLALYYHPDVLAHDPGQHPEHSGRLRAIVETLEREAQTTPLQAPEPADLAQVTRIHAPSYVAALEEFIGKGGGPLTLDTAVSADSFPAALRAAGGAIAAATAVVVGEAQRAFALVRPPGHHARPAQAMGFCLFNNVAIAARELKVAHGVRRSAIVDLDVHHGNGSQESFYDDPTVLYVSTHEYGMVDMGGHRVPFYPGTGPLDETGTGDGKGTTINLPLPPGCGDDAYLAVLESVVLPALRRFRPELVLVSLGYDAHWADPLAQMQLTIGGYVAMVERLAAAADELCRGRLALVLEGGYDLDVLGHGVLATVRALRGEPWSDPVGAAPHQLPPQTVDPIVARARRLHRLDG